MATRGQRHPKKRIAWLEQRDKYRLVRLRPRMRLHIGVTASEKLLCALNRKRFGDIDKFAAAVIAATRITLGIFVGQHRALGFEHCPRNDVFACYQLDLRLLAFALAGDRRGEFRIDLAKRVGEKAVDGGSMFGGMG